MRLCRKTCSRRSFKALMGADMFWSFLSGCVGTGRVNDLFFPHRKLPGIDRARSFTPRKSYVSRRTRSIPRSFLARAAEHNMRRQMIPFFSYFSIRRPVRYRSKAPVKHCSSLAVPSGSGVSLSAAMSSILLKLLSGWRTGERLSTVRRCSRGSLYHCSITPGC